MKRLGTLDLDLQPNVYEGRDHVTVTAHARDGSWDLVSFYLDGMGRLCLTRHESVGTPDLYLTDDQGRMVPDDEVPQ